MWIALIILTNLISDSILFHLHYVSYAYSFLSEYNWMFYIHVCLHKSIVPVLHTFFLCVFILTDYNV